MGKRAGRHHSTTSFSENFVLAETSNKVLEVYHFGAADGLTSFNKDNCSIFWRKGSTIKLSGVSIIKKYAKKL